jgi:hypothetical protein
MSLFKRPLNATAQHGKGKAWARMVCMILWAMCPRSVSTDHDEEFHDWQFAFFRLHADFHEGHGTGMCELQRHGTAQHSRDTAWYM